MNFNIVSILKKLDIDITTKRDVTLIEYKNLYDFFHNLSVEKIIFNKLIDKLIEKVPSIEIKYDSKEYFIEKYFKYLDKNNKILYFYYTYFIGYTDKKIYINMYWCGKKFRNFKYDKNMLNMEEMQEAINFFKDSPFFEMKITNKINICLGEYDKITDEIINENANLISKLF